MMIEILLIAVICVIVIDLSGFIESIELGLSRMLNFKVKIPKPFSCSLCSTFWLSVIYLLVVHRLSIFMIAYALLIAYSTSIIKDIIQLLKDLMVKAIGLLYDKMNL